MNRQEYLYELEKALKAAHVSDCADILEEYAAHFDMKTSDGYGEEEIAARLAPPSEIAAQFADIKQDGGAVKAGRAVLAAGLFVGDIFTGGFFTLLYLWVVSLGAFSLGSAVTGVFMACGGTIGGAGEKLAVLIPQMPFICSLLFGISLLSLGVLAAVGTEYCRLYVTQMLRVYARWHRKVLGKNGNVSPPLSLHPLIKPKKRRIMRSVALVSLVVFAVTFIAALGSMMIATGSFEPWHVWHWFE